MGKTFLNHYQPLLTVMLQCETPETIIRRVRNSLHLGADAFGVQIESLKEEYHNPETYKRIFAEMKNKPCYVTYYRDQSNSDKTDEELGEGLLTLAESGATLCDVLGDLYCQQPGELTDNPEAIAKQMDLISQLHERGAEVLMSSHVMKYTPAERVLEIALEQKRRGADVIKIVTRGDTMAEQIENLRITDLLRRELGAPFLYLSGGDSTSLHRRLGIKLGCCMALCVYEHDHLSTAAQPLLQTMKTIRDNLDI